jgi:fibronectin type 3 domain-containing protein
LAVVERGGEILISFHAPPRTTDSLAIKEFSEIDLRIGPAAAPFDFGGWAASATKYVVKLPERNDPDNPQAIQISHSLPVSGWQGQHVVVAVRTAVKKNEHYSSWSNHVVLDVVAPLEPPAIKAEATGQGVALSWPDQGAGLRYRVYRRAASDKDPAEIGTADQPSFLDAAAQYDVDYQYSVVAVKGLAESLSSNAFPIKPIDKFAPSVPAGVTALAGPDSIEVSWQRSPESDLQGYFVYRAVNGAPFERQGELVALPTYSDRKAEHGKTYQYQVSSVDKKNNESARSAAAEAIF